MSIAKKSNFTGHFLSVSKKIMAEPNNSNKEELISISRMASLTETNRDTLVYYIKEGLITPAVTTESGYKYFLPDQIRTMTNIKLLRRCGIHISEIRRMMQEMDADEIFRVLERQRDELEEQIQTLKRSLAFLEKLGEFLESADPREMDISRMADLAEKAASSFP